MYIYKFAQSRNSPAHPDSLALAFPSPKLAQTHLSSLKLARTRLTLKYIPVAAADAAARVRHGAGPRAAVAQLP